MNILGKETTQTVADNATALQAGGNITITNGLSIEDVTRLFDILFKNQFPIIQEVAKEQAIINKREFEKIVIQDLHNNAKNIIIEKFQDPDIQALLNDAITSAARKGKKSHPELLSKIIVEKVSDGGSDLLDIILTEAVEVIPKITKEQIALICALFILRDVKVKKMVGNVFYKLEDLHGRYDRYFGVDFKLSMTNIKHVIYVGACNYSENHAIDAETVYVDKYNKFDVGSYDEAAKMLKVLTPVTSRFIEHVQYLSRSGLVLTSVGQAIAIAALKQIDDFEYSTWLK
ncbi:hypothetical protein GSE37_20770 [Klebsiella variicola]|uniref:LPO_1073/Vpar_1526 family protein n=1 Tax=Klebsiella variicola TaxID=244366 RepID=UPI001FA73F78|nr:LPO_1073/Vpar_1526 family protein [Klebsiella variicola]MCI4426585.1 hypothetical protein [Klebsiella variicola]